MIGANWHSCDSRCNNQTALFNQLTQKTRLEITKSELETEEKRRTLGASAPPPQPVSIEHNSVTRNRVTLFTFGTTPQNNRARVFDMADRSDDRIDGELDDAMMVAA